MRTSPLGTDRLQVSVVGLGCNNFGRPGFVTEDLTGTRRVLDAAIDHGITLLDTAAYYGGPESLSEVLMGRALQGRRDRVVIATKWGFPEGPEPAAWGARGSRTFVRNACEASLRRLGTDHIDLFQLHRPDPDTPVEETLGALDELVDEGKIRFFGHSDFDAAQVVEAVEAADRTGGHRFVSAQNQYSLLARGAERDLLPTLRERGLGLLPFFPLANGLLTGKYAQHDAAPEGSRLARIPDRFAGVTQAQWQAIERYRDLCGELGLPMVQVTFAWLLAQPAVASVIAGATSAEQVAQNAAAADVGLPAEVVARIGEIFADR